MLDEKQADQILQADIQNIVRKVTDGKSLTNQEREVIAKYKAEKKTAKNITELSKLLGVSRQSIYNWKEQDGSPENLDVQTWQEFIELKEAMSGQGANKLGYSGKEWTQQEILDLKAQEMQERARRQRAERKLKELELKKIEENLVPYSTAKEVVLNYALKVQRLLQNFPKKYALRIDPTNTEEAEMILAECVNETITQITEPDNS